jgi:thiol:disulfide interchange protein
MPIGSIFGALFFGGLCTWMGLSILATPGPASRLVGATLALLGLTLAGGLVLRRSWARWGGVLGAFLVLLLVILRDAEQDSAVLANLLLLGSILVALLLLLPATGDPWRGRGAASAASSSPRGWREVLGPALATLGAAGLLAGLWLPQAPVAEEKKGQLPRSAVAQHVQWTDWEAGLSRASAEGKPLLVTFVTDWCPYCKKMDQGTWRAAPVVERLSQVVAVRVDADVSEELAARYEVRGLPATMLIDHEGRVLSRADGYLRPAELLDWLDRGLQAVR